MLLSRFWYVILAAMLGIAVFVLYLAMSMYNRAGARASRHRSHREPPATKRADPSATGGSGSPVFWNGRAAATKSG